MLMSTRLSSPADTADTTCSIRNATATCSAVLPPSRVSTDTPPRASAACASNSTGSSSTTPNDLIASWTNANWRPTPVRVPDSKNVLSPDPMFEPSTIMSVWSSESTPAAAIVTAIADMVDDD